MGGQIDTGVPGTANFGGVSRPNLTPSAVQQQPPEPVDGSGAGVGAGGAAAGDGSK